MSTDIKDCKELKSNPDKSDLIKLIQFANRYKTAIIPRTAGTSLAGQVVGNGIVVDISKYFTEIIEFNKSERWIIVQPGVILDELNISLRKDDFVEQSADI